MTELRQTYNFNSLYICCIILIYSIFISNYEYIKLFIRKITLYNYTSLILVINIIAVLMERKHRISRISISKPAQTALFQQVGQTHAATASKAGLI